MRLQNYLQNVLTNTFILTGIHLHVNKYTCNVCEASANKKYSKGKMNSSSFEKHNLLFYNK